MFFFVKGGSEAGHDPDVSWLNGLLFVCLYFIILLAQRTKFRFFDRNIGYR